jgi:hypothetical protein
MAIRPRTYAPVLAFDAAFMRRHVETFGVASDIPSGAIALNTSK